MAFLKQGVKAYINKISKFSVKMFLLILLCVAVPLAGTCIYVQKRMEKVIQEKISERMIQNISRSERDIIRMLQNMSAWSNFMALDAELLERLQDGTVTEFDNLLYFNQIVDKMLVTSGEDLITDTKIILFDNYGRVYSNWSLDFQDYEFLLEEDWVKASQTSDGHMTWSMFSPAYIRGEKQDTTYISLARPILDYGTVGRQIGTLIMSIEQYQFSEVLMSYAYEGDAAFVCIGDDRVLLSNDQDSRIGEDKLKQLSRQTASMKSGSLRCDEKGKEYLVSYYTIPGPWLFDNENMKVFHFTDYQGVLDEVHVISSAMSRIMALAFILVIVLAFVSVRLLVRPILLLTGQMEQYTIGREITGIDINRSDEIGHLNRAFCRLVDNIQQLFQKLGEENRIKEQYRYESLRAQLNPHFLFNTLTTIRWMAMIRGADNMVESIDALANVLKYSMSRDDRLVTLKEELDNIESYVCIHNYRYQDYCSLDVDIPEDLQELRMMKFILQPVVENAILHGFDKQREQILIRIYGYTEESTLYLFVEDDGVGISENVIREFEASRQTRGRGSKMTGIGLDNVDSCIRITFGEAYGLKLERCGNHGTSVMFKLPVINSEEDDDEANHDS